MPHLTSHSFRRAVLVLALAAAFAAAGVWALGANETAAGGSGATAMSVDTNISGNSASSIGATDAASALNPCDTFTVDVTVTDIPASNPMVGFGFTIGYDAANVDIQTADSGYLLAAAPGSALFVPPPEFEPDAVRVSGADLNPGAAESGSGVLTRLTGVIAAGADPGSYPLTLSEAAHIDDQNVIRQPDVLNSGAFNIDGSCNGDVDCSLAINSVDSLKVLRHNAGLSVSQTEPCADISSDIGPRNQGDVDCNSTINSVDALKILRASVSLSVSQTQPCPPIVP